MSSIIPKRVSGALISSTPSAKELNAETVTAIATGFLKRIGNKGKLKAKRVSLEEGIYTVEVEMKRLTAIIQVDSKTHEIKAYEIQTRAEETQAFTISLKMILVCLGIASITYFVMNYFFETLGI